MPRGMLLRGAARTAVVAGTATAVSGRVQRRQSQRWAEEPPPVQEQPVQAAPAPAVADPIAQLKELGELHSSGVLTDEEFAAQKAKLLG